MARVTIVISDEPGGARLRAEFDPPLKREQVELGDMTPAQGLGLGAVLGIQEAVSVTGGKTEEVAFNEEAPTTPREGMN